MLGIKQGVQPESQLAYVLRQGDVLFYRRRKDLSKRSGVPINTLNKVMQRVTENPSSATIQKVFNALKAEELRISTVAKKNKKTIASQAQTATRSDYSEDGK